MGRGEEEINMMFNNNKSNRNQQKSVDLWGGLSDTKIRRSFQSTTWICHSVTVADASYDDGLII
jgi:hypothetical protein